MHPARTRNCSHRWATRHRIDTSDLNPNALRAWIKEFGRLRPLRADLAVPVLRLQAWHPLDADFVFDVRCLPNPHYDPLLRPLTGKDAAVAAFLESDAHVQKMLGDILRFVEDWLPCFIRDNRNYLTVALAARVGSAPLGVIRPKN